jgi:hypothetical protein
MTVTRSQGLSTAHATQKVKPFTIEQEGITDIHR